jgi:hypothetical protein
MLKTHHIVAVRLHDDLLQYELTQEQSHVYLYLMTSRAMTPIGVCQESPDNISRYTGLSIPEVEKALDGLVTHEILYRWEGNWIFAVYRFLSESPKYANQKISYYLTLTSCPDYIQRIVLSFHSRIKVDHDMIIQSQMGKKLSELIADDLANDTWEPDVSRDFTTFPQNRPKKPRNPHQN